MSSPVKRIPPEILAVARLRLRAHVADVLMSWFLAQHVADGLTLEMVNGRLPKFDFMEEIRRLLSGDKSAKTLDIISDLALALGGELVLSLRSARPFEPPLPPPASPAEPLPEASAS